VQIEAEFGFHDNEISTQPSSVEGDITSPNKLEEETRENDCIFQVSGKRLQPEEKNQDNDCEPSQKKQCGSLN
jgi:hypothetical protein